MFCKKDVLITSQNSTENTCVGVVSFSEVEGYRSSPPEVFLGKIVLKYAANLQENTEDRNLSVTLLKRDSGTGVFL